MHFELFDLFPVDLFLNGVVVGVLRLFLLELTNFLLYLVNLGIFSLNVGLNVIFVFFELLTSIRILSLLDKIVELESNQDLLGLIELRLLSLINLKLLEFLIKLLHLWCDFILNHIIDFFQLKVLLLDEAFSFQPFLLVHCGTSCFLNHV